MSATGLQLAYVSGSALPSRAANSVHVMKMCAALSRRGHVVTLLAWRGLGTAGDLYATYGVPQSFSVHLVDRPGLRWARPMVYASAARACLRERRLKTFDVLYGRHRYALWLARSTASRIVFEAHAPPRKGHEWLVERALFRDERFERLVVISEALKTEYLHRFPFLAADRIVVAHDGADIPSSLQIGATGHREANASIVIGYVGHLYPGKGMEIIAALAPLVPEYRFVIVGGTEADLKHWKNKVSSPNVDFVGYLAHGDLADVVCQMDIVLAPYQNKVSVAGNRGDVARWMSPLKIFEYMASGKAIIASDLPVLGEVLVHRRNSLLVAADDVAAWKDAVLELARCERLRHDLGTRAFQDFSAQFTWDARAERVLEAIEARQTS